MFKTSEIKQELETLNGFELWLMSKQADDVVGFARSSCRCPFSLFLIEQQFASDPVVLPFGIAGDRVFVKPSKVAQRFIQFVDSISIETRSVQAHQAHAALLQARQEARS